MRRTLSMLAMYFPRTFLAARSWKPASSGVTPSLASERRGDGADRCLLLWWCFLEPSILCEEAARKCHWSSLYGALVIMSNSGPVAKNMTQQLKTRKKVTTGKRSSRVHADPRLVELIKYLARHAAERDYEHIQSVSAKQKDSPGNAGKDS